MFCRAAPPARSFPDERALIRTVTSTASTNDDMAALARAGAPEGSWIRAEAQTGGRGRQGRAWQSPSGNLYASTLIRLLPGDPEAASLSLVAGVALHEVVQAYAHPVPLLLKWPNDLLADGAKLAGILLERHDDAVIAGFGVNLSAHPEGLDRPATSIRALTGQAPDPALFLEDFASALTAWLVQWRAGGLDRIRPAWLARAHPVGTALSTTDSNGSRIDGLFDGLDDRGALRLRLPDGTIEVIQAGDVFLI